jgi:hypothetical protein
MVVRPVYVHRFLFKETAENRKQTTAGFQSRLDMLTLVLWHKINLPI